MGIKMKLPEVPCIEDKCLLYPACKNKYIIKCDIIFCKLQRISFQESGDMDDIFDRFVCQIHRILPNVNKVVNSNSAFYYIYDERKRIRGI